eukprot:gene20943-27144_t
MRKETLSASNNKRNYLSMAGDIASIPSTGVASTGGFQVVCDILARNRWLPGRVTATSAGSIIEIVGGNRPTKEFSGWRNLAMAQKCEEEQKA